MLIGIMSSTGAGSGKDALADIIITISNKSFTKYSFAKPLKDGAAAMFGWNNQHLYGNLKEVVDPFWGFSPRKAMQLLGTEFGRNMLRDDIWIKAAEDFYKRVGSTIIPDVRFDNEAEFILSNKGVLIDIRRDHARIELSSHKSESGISEQWKSKAVIVSNDGGLKDLVVKAEQILTDYYCNVNSA